MVVLLPGVGALGEAVPETVRIQGVSTSGFQALVVVPPGPTENRSTMTVAYMAVLPGTHMLSDGAYIEAGTMATSDRQMGTACALSGATSGWDIVSFDAMFSSPPAVVTTLQTANNEQGAVPRFFSKPWLTVACQDLSATSVSISLESAETARVGTLDSAEEVGYVAMSVGQGSFSAGQAVVQYVAMQTGEVIKGFDDGLTTVTLPATFTGLPLVLGGQTTRNGNNGGWLRLSSTSSSSVTLFIEEDKYCDTERAHIEEDASILAFSQPFVLGTTTTTTTTTTTGTMGSTATMEVGEVTVQSGSWTSVVFSVPFAEVPVVVLAPTAQGDEPAAIRIKDVTATGSGLATSRGLISGN